MKSPILRSPSLVIALILSSVGNTILCTAQQNKADSIIGDIVEINAAQKPIIIQLPIYDDNVQEFIRACK